MNFRPTRILLFFVLSLLLVVGCDDSMPGGGTTPGPDGTPGTATPGSGQEPTVVPSPTIAPTPTAKPLDITMQDALAELKPLALAWHSDARLVMIANVRPGQEARLLGVALGDPDVSEPTPGGLGRNWALIAFSPSTKGAVVITRDGAQTDLVKEGALTGNMVESLGAPAMSALALFRIDPTKLADPVKLIAAIEKDGQKTVTMSMAMLAPTGLGIIELPTPTSGMPAPNLVYELFSADPTQPRYVIYDAITGVIILDSAKP